MNLISTYFNPSIERSKMPQDLEEGKATLKSPTVIWEYGDSKTSHYPVAGGYSMREIEENRKDFEINFNNLRKYPKMTEKDWE